MSNRKILVVEDDADVRLGYHILLKAHNYDTVFASDSASALGEATKHQPDLIILDLGLPGGDGFLVLARLRTVARLAVVPVIVVSSWDLPRNKDRALAAGARAFIEKPWEDDWLLGSIRELLNQTPESRPLPGLDASGERKAVSPHSGNRPL